METVQEYMIWRKGEETTITLLDNGCTYECSLMMKGGFAAGKEEKSYCGDIKETDWQTSFVCVCGPYTHLHTHTAALLRDNYH